MLKESFTLMANYNQWMNIRTYEAASQLTELNLSKNQGAYFGSILCTLNHIFVADTIWLKRFGESPFQFSSLRHLQNRASPKSLDTIVYDNFRELNQSRRQLDLAILNFIQELSEDIIKTHLTYINMKGEPFKKTFNVLLLHFFNHQTTIEDRCLRCYIKAVLMSV